MSLAYARYYDELTAITETTVRLVESANPGEKPALRALLVEARERTAGDGPLRVALIGEFSAGKSSLIAALTGADVVIDADVSTTTTTEFSWHGLTLVDTPGVQAEDQDTDHDRIAREATVGADLVLFVVTNELFNPRLAEHLRHILDDAGLGLAKKTAVVINKIDRESNPEVELLGEVAKVLSPHEDTRVYFCAASKFLQARSAPPELRSRFVKQSRVTKLIDEIDRFVDDAGTFGRLITPLQLVAEAVDSLQALLVASDDDRKQLELIRRQKAVLQRLQRRLFDIRKTWKQQAFSVVMGQANSVVEQIGEVTTGDDLERLFKTGIKQAIAEIDQLYDGVEADITAAVADAQRDIEEIGGSPLAQDVSRINAQRGERVAVDFTDAKPSRGSLAAKLGRVAAKPVQEGLDAAAKNAKGLRDVVYNVGKTFGKKFRPWEAVKSGEKLAKVAGKAGKALPLLAAALDFYIQYREEKAKEEKARYLANMRLSLRNAFADQAQVEADALEAVVLQVSHGPVSEALDALDAGSTDIASATSDRQALAQNFAAVKARCTRLRSQLMSGTSNRAKET